MKLIPRDDEEYVLGVNPLSIEPLNMDFDGDMSATYVNHDNTALKEMYEHAYLQNVTQYDANYSYLATIRHDALYSAFILSYKYNEIDKENFISVDSLNNLPINIDLLNNPYKTVKLNNDFYSYGICLINYWLGFNKIIINTLITKKQIQLVSKLAYEYYDNSKDYYDAIGNLEKHLMTYITISNFVPTINIDQMSSVVDDNLHYLFNKIPSHNQYIAYYINNALIDKAVENFDHECNLYKLYKSGSRFSKNQLARSCINIGLIADENNIVNAEPINSSLIEGLTEKQFFMSSYGTRKGIVDKSRATPKSGYLERTLVMAMGCMEIAEDDCGTQYGIEITVQNKEHVKSILNKYYKISQNDSWKLLSSFGDGEKLIGQKIILRSPMKCKTKDFKICKKCFGEKPNRTKYVGIVAAQCITERLTQLSLRSFHESGSANLGKNDIINECIKNHLIDIQETNHDITLKFNSSILPIDEFKKVIGFKEQKDNYITYNKINDEIINLDAVETINDVNMILRKQNNITESPNKYYEKLINAILTVGEIYSSYVEMVLAHLFIVDGEEFWRYNYNKPIIYKTSDKAVASKISPLLGFLYQPNKQTINNFDDDFIDVISSKKQLTLHEKIFLQNYDIKDEN